MEVPPGRSGNYNPFTVAIYPDEFSVDENVAREIFDPFGLRKQDYDLELAQKILKRHLGRIGVPYLDLLEALKEGNKRGRVYLLRNTHWNDRGILIVADFLFDKLIEVINSNKNLHEGLPLRPFEIHEGNVILYKGKE